MDDFRSSNGETPVRGVNIETADVTLQVSVSILGVLQSSVCVCVCVRAGVREMAQAQQSEFYSNSCVVTGLHATACLSLLHHSSL